VLVPEATYPPLRVVDKAASSIGQWNALADAGSTTNCESSARSRDPAVKEGLAFQPATEKAAARRVTMGANQKREALAALQTNRHLSV